MTAVAITAKQRQLPAELEQEILARIGRAGLHVCEAELRYKLRWEERKHGSLLELLDELERQGLIRERDPLPAHRARPRTASRRP